MDNAEIYISATRSDEDLAGVFESDGDTGYFYLYRNSGPQGKRIAGTIHLFSGAVDIKQDDVSIQWSDDETVVGLFIHRILWAAFDSAGAKYGGNFQEHAQPGIPIEIESHFRRASNK